MINLAFAVQAYQFKILTFFFKNKPNNFLNNKTQQQCSTLSGLWNSLTTVIYILSIRLYPSLLKSSFMDDQSFFIFYVYSHFKLWSTYLFCRCPINIPVYNIFFCILCQDIRFYVLLVYYFCCRVFCKYIQKKDI